MEWERGAGTGNIEDRRMKPAGFRQHYGWASQSFQQAEVKDWFLEPMIGEPLYNASLVPVYIPGMDPDSNWRPPKFRDTPDKICNRTMRRHHRGSYISDNNFGLILYCSTIFVNVEILLHAIKEGPNNGCQSCIGNLP